jgi:RNA polymerase sigma factor (sigma-70 family)
MLRRRGTTSKDDGAPDAIEVVRVGYPRLLLMARRLSASDAEAEDLVQEAFVETLSRYPDFAGLHSPMGYLTTVLYRAAFRRRSLTGSEVPLELQERLEQEEPDREAPMMIAVALSSLAPGQRTCLILRYLYDLDDEEIAAVLGCRPSTVRSQVARGLAHARKLLTG